MKLSISVSPSYVRMETLATGINVTSLQASCSPTHVQGPKACVVEASAGMM